jgi:hypothetical protein
MRFDATKGPQRATLSGEVASKLAPNLALLREDRRRRPLYFDGRFLAARDLTREQDYFLARQADLGRAGGFGVATGLLASRAGSRLRISPGHGVTPSGELVVLTEPMVLDVAQIEASEVIRARMGITKRIERPGTRTGLYVVALRPVEYEANPIAQYPTSLDGERSVHNGDIIEASALTLIPYPDLGEPTELRFRRAHAAKEIFVDRVQAGAVTDALPLAMVAIDRGTLLWVDPHLVRREIGAEAGDILGVSGAPLALREAHMLQYGEHLRDLLASVHGGIVASQHFLALPPAGPMPKSAIDRQLFAQRFFPAEVDVDLTIVAADELGALLEEARLLPPIDLGDAEELRSTSVLVVVPVDRGDLDPARARLVGARRKLPPAAPNLLAKRRPLERLATMPLLRQELRPWVPTANPDDLAWRALLDLDHANDLVWYLRRRNTSKKPEIVGEIVVTRPPEGEVVITRPPEGEVVITRPPEGETPADPSTRALIELAASLKDYGINARDVQRIDPKIVRFAVPLLAQITQSSQLFGAAALIELSHAPPLEDEREAQPWLEVLKERFTLARSAAEELLHETFAPGRPGTEVFLRAGILHEILAPLAALMRDAARLRSWQGKLRELERAPRSAKNAASLRRLIFAILDIQQGTP